MGKRIYYGELLYAARRHLDLTQSQIAGELGVSQSCFSKMESDRLEPSLSHLVWLTQKILCVDLIEAFNIALEPIRVAIEQEALSRDHKNRLHQKEPDDLCSLCFGEEAAAKLIAARGQERQQQLAAKSKKGLISSRSTGAKT